MFFGIICGTLFLTRTQRQSFRTPRSMRFIAHMSIQRILRESTALIAAVGTIQLYFFMYNNNSLSFSDMHLTAYFFSSRFHCSKHRLRFNSFSFRLQMSYSKYRCNAGLEEEMKEAHACRFYFNFCDNVLLFP